MKNDSICEYDTGLWCPRILAPYRIRKPGISIRDRWSGTKALLWPEEVSNLQLIDKLNFFHKLVLDGFKASDMNIHLNSKQLKSFAIFANLMFWKCFASVLCTSFSISVSLTRLTNCISCCLLFIRIYVAVIGSGNFFRYVLNSNDFWIKLRSFHAIFTILSPVDVACRKKLLTT